VILDQKGFSSFKITTEKRSFASCQRQVASAKQRPGRTLLKRGLFQIRSALCLFTSFWKNIKEKQFPVLPLI